MLPSGFVVHVVCFPVCPVGFRLLSLARLRIQATGSEEKPSLQLNRRSVPASAVTFSIGIPYLIDGYAVVADPEVRECMLFFVM